MKKDTVIASIIGLLAGCVIGFTFANAVNQKGVAASDATELKANSNMPPGHPEVAGMGSINSKPNIEAVVEKAKLAPDDFDAQLDAADAFYRIDKFDEAEIYLAAANKLKPEASEVVVYLGNVNFDASDFKEAEKWYLAALSKDPRDVDVRTDLGLTFVSREPPDYDRAIKEFNRSLELEPDHGKTLQSLTIAYTRKRDARKASESLAKLTEIDPKNTAIEKLRADIDTIRK